MSTENVQWVPGQYIAKGNFEGSSWEIGVRIDDDTEPGQLPRWQWFVSVEMRCLIHADLSSFENTEEEAKRVALDTLKRILVAFR